MFLHNIFVSNFRNYETYNITLNKGINIFYGNNAQGKTNFLESIYVLALTKSHRSFIDNNLIQNGKTSSKIKGKIEINNIPSELEILISPKGKKLKIDNNEIKRISDYISKINIIIFYPEDLDLVKGAPADRRRYINLELSQLYSGYLNVLSDYNRLLKMRNDYLKKNMSTQNPDEKYFDALTTYLIEKAVTIYRMRQKFINKLNINSATVYKNITGHEGFRIEYKHHLELESFTKEEITIKLEEKYKHLFLAEKKLGTTLAGPHRDDFEFYLNDLNIKNFGSQGQQRVAVLSLKLGEIDIFKTYKGTNPILLLDDVFSELDDLKKNNLLMYISGDIQTIITTTDLKNLDKKFIESAQLFEVNKGSINRIEKVEKHGRKKTTL